MTDVDTTSLENRLAWFYFPRVDDTRREWVTNFLLDFHHGDKVCYLTRPSERKAPDLDPLMETTCRCALYAAKEKCRAADILEPNRATALDSTVSSLPPVLQSIILDYAVDIVSVVLPKTKPFIRVYSRTFQQIRRWLTPRSSVATLGSSGTTSSAASPSPFEMSSFEATWLDTTPLELETVLIRLTPNGRACARLIPHTGDASLLPYDILALEDTAYVESVHGGSARCVIVGPQFYSPCG